MQIGQKVKVIACRRGATSFIGRVGVIVSQKGDQLVVELKSGDRHLFWPDELICKGQLLGKTEKH